MIINSKTNLKEIITNIEQLKDEYTRELKKFGYFDLPKKTFYTNQFKKNVFSANVVYWKLEIVWEYLNGDLQLEELKKILKVTLMNNKNNTINFEELSKQETVYVKK